MLTRRYVGLPIIFMIAGHLMKKQHGSYPVKHGLFLIKFVIGLDEAREPGSSGALAGSKGGGDLNQCNHPQCCICLKRECQQTVYERRFKKYGNHHVCGESCLATAVSVAYYAACRLGGAQEKPCGREAKDSAAVLSEPWQVKP
jgi:hypothetical protein